MTYLERIAQLNAKAADKVAYSRDEPRFVGFIIDDAAGAIDSGEVDRAYTLFTASIALMYGWLDTLPFTEESGEVARLRPGSDRDRLVAERALVDRYARYPLAYAGHVITDLMIAERYGLSDASRLERYGEIVRAVRSVPPGELERPLLWILATRR